jgi:hypothetical protein
MSNCSVERDFKKVKSRVFRGTFAVNSSHRSKKGGKKGEKAVTDSQAVKREKIEKNTDSQAVSIKHG